MVGLLCFCKSGQESAGKGEIEQFLLIFSIFLRIRYPWRLLFELAGPIRISGFRAKLEDNLSIVLHVYILEEV